MVQKQYADIVVMRLEQCTVSSHNPYKANFRCHICGDSKRNKRKRRGFILERNASLGYYCHNGCGSFGFSKYLELHHADLHSRYVLDLMQASGYQPRTESAVEKPKVTTKPYLESLTVITKLSWNHPAVQYVRQRKIPIQHYESIYYTDKFLTYINSWLPDKFSPDLIKVREHSRLILPLMHSDKTTFGVIGRSLDPNDEMRYLTLKFDDSANKIYGLERLDLRKHAYVFEGAIDSLFVPNSIALAGTDGCVDDVFTSHDQYTIVLDNQPRSKQVISKYAKYLSQGADVVIWPDHITSKDVNQMILDGFTASQVLEIIQQRTFNGLMGEIELNKWKKV